MGDFSRFLFGDFEFDPKTATPEIIGPAASLTSYGRAPWLVAAAAVFVAVAVLIWFGRGPDPFSTTPDSASRPPDIAAFAALKPYQLTAGTGYDGFLAFAPDGKSIAFSSDRSGALEIYVQGVVPGSTATALTSNGKHNVRPVWSPDAQFIAYHEMAANGIWIVPSRGGVARKVSDFGSHPAWSPDGRRLAFHSLPTTVINSLGIPGALSTIWIVDALGRHPPTAVTTAGEPAGPHLAPAWLPDSRRLLFAVPAGPGSGRGPSLWSVDVETRRLLKISANERITAEYTLAPDGRGLYFQGRSSAIWWLPLSVNGESGGEPQPTGIPAIGSVIAHLVISSDGRRLAWTALNTSDHVWASYLRDGNNIAAPLTEGEGIRYGLP
jgi:Tol biopolymer transport system component